MIVVLTFVRYCTLQWSTLRSDGVWSILPIVVFSSSSSFSSSFLLLLHLREDVPVQKAKSLLFNALWNPPVLPALPFSGFSLFSLSLSHTHTTVHFGLALPYSLCHDMKWIMHLIKLPCPLICCQQRIKMGFQKRFSGPGKLLTSNVLLIKFTY